MPEKWEEWLDDVHLPVRRALPHGTTSQQWSASTFNLTNCTQPRHRNQLCRDDVSNLVRASLEFHETRGTWRLHACVLMPDHAPLILTVSADTRLAHTIAYWKRYVAKEAGVRWQRDFFEHRYGETSTSQ
jgi:REP element-mobilizing transposase RayT